MSEIENIMSKIKNINYSKENVIQNESVYYITSFNDEQQISDGSKLQVKNINKSGKLSILQQIKRDLTLFNLKSLNKHFIINNIILISIIFLTFITSFGQGNCSTTKQKITLKVGKSGNTTIMFESFYNRNKPNKTYINNISNDQISNAYDTNINDTITLIWYYYLDSTNLMFSGCKDIIEIDLSDFDSSLVNDTSLMFKECSSLISLNLSNFKTSKVQYMQFMFYG